MKASRVFWGSTLAAAAVTALAVPAHATLQLAVDISGSPALCVDNAVCDANPAIGQIQINTGSLNGVTINGTFDYSVKSGGNQLSTSSLTIFNTTSIAKTITFVLSDTNFTAPVSQFSTSASATWTASQGATATLKWYADPANAQGANSVLDTPGSVFDSASYTVTQRADSFHYSNTLALLQTSPFSMTEWAQLTLPAKGTLNGFSETVIAVPEPSVWAMMLLGFAGLGFAGYRGRKRAASIA